METIFDHNPTPLEVKELTGGMTKPEYTSHWMYSKDHCILDIVLLYELRQNAAMAEKYRSHIPDLYQQWQLGLDHVIYPVD